jgi:hypothetical protein
MSARPTFGRFTSIPEQTYTSSYACENCGSTRGDIGTIFTDDGRKPMLCEDCRDEVRRLEAKADFLAAKPGCEERQGIIEKAETTEWLVNTLECHDITCRQCCPSVLRKPATSECGAPAAEVIA